jgi:hypothetical protein
MDTLLKSLEPRGFTAQVDEEKGHTHLVGGSTTLTISIVEQVTRTSHTPTRSEVQARDRYYHSFRVGARAEYPNIPQFDWHPTGRLTLAVGSWPSRKWNDTERSLIDSRLSGIVAAIVGLAEAKRANEEEEERRRRTYEEARALYETQVRARDDDELTPEKQQWLEWAKAKADWLDPLVRRSDPILDAPEPEAPSYWRF